MEEEEEEPSGQKERRRLWNSFLPFPFLDGTVSAACALNLVLVACMFFEALSVDLMF